jgi:hypothetical protein
MNLLPASELPELLRDRPGPFVSLYFSTRSDTTRRPQGRVRLRHLLDQTGARLAAQDLDDATVEVLLEPFEALLDDTTFWGTRQAGAALFRSPGFFRAFQLPREFPERCAVSDCFFLKPLLPLVASDDRFYVLALSQNQVRLLEATALEVRRPAVKDLPANLTDALGAQKTPQMVQYHTASGRSGMPATFHGQGVGHEDVKEELRRYLLQVDAAVRKFLAAGKAPLVLAGAEPLLSIYRKVSGYAHLAETAIPGNPERTGDEELRDRAWQLLQPGFQELRRRTAERFGELASKGQASNDAREILPAARHGRVDTLFLACDADLWGRLDPLEKVELHALPQAGDEELLNTAALYSLRHGGTVFGLDRGEVPGGTMLAAIYRY